MKVRIIPGFQISKGELVHVFKFDKSTKRYIGDPLNTLRIFNQFDCDELSIVDIDSWKHGVNFSLLEKISEEIFLPLSYGGGVKNFDEASKIISLGFEKLIFNDSIFSNKALIEEFSKNYGSQAVVLKINIIKHKDNYYIFDHKNSKILDEKIDNILDKINNINASELSIIITNLDGTFNGPDLDFIKNVKRKTNKHLVYSGGISKNSDFNNCFKAGANAIITNNFFIMKKKNGGIIFTNPKKNKE